MRFFVANRLPEKGMVIIMEKFLVVGGDLRQVYLAGMLAKSYTVYAAGFDRNLISSDRIKLIDNLITLPERVNYIVLPLQASNDGVMVNAPYCRQSIPLVGLTSVIEENGIVFGGKMNNAVKSIFNKCGLDTVDYLDREELNVLNAVPTAEGAIQIAMEELATAIYGQKALVTGFGRISKVLVKILNGLGAETAVAARKYSDLAWAEIMGCEGIHISRLEEKINEYNIVFNTVPAVILNERILGRISKDALIIDLASKPGGVDFDAAAREGIKVVWALSIPGKVAPITSGEIIAGTIINILKERRGSDA